jgi:hypothetical protein
MVACAGQQPVLIDAPMCVEEAAEVAAEAAFREVISRVSADEKAFVAWQADRAGVREKAHVVTVLHQKAQNAVGEKFGCQVSQCSGNRDTSLLGFFPLAVCSKLCE